ncbi:hypothetical protein [Microbacterium sp. NPDC087665]|uniref:hypothetical protein n=1 Tax=Microbacterium sp. NPDC087665 TaxID=3364194 RepID=UPI00381E5227
MDTPFATERTTYGPISPDWTINELIEWLADDARQHEAALQHPLALIEAAATGSVWRSAPSTVALIRSLVEAARTSPALGATTVRELVDMRAASAGAAGTHPRTRHERMPQTQLAGVAT